MHSIYFLYSPWTFVFRSSQHGRGLFFFFDGRNDGAQGSATTPTRDGDFLALAADVLQHSSLDNDPPPLNQCFVFGQGKPITLPPRPEIGHHERTTAGVLEFSKIKGLRFGHEGCTYLYCFTDTYILEF